VTSDRKGRAEALPDDLARDVVGRRAELRLLLGTVQRGKAVLLVGLPGVSKTTMLRALAHHLGSEADRFVDVTGDEQLTAHLLVGTFDPATVLRGGYRPEHFVPGPLTRAMTAGGILYVEEVNRAPSGALNALLTALSEGYVEVPHLGRVDARPGFTIVGALNPLDDVGTARLSRGLLDRCVVLELDYQPRDEELEIVRRRCSDSHPALRALAVDVARESRRHPDLRHGASVRAAIDLVDLVGGYLPEELDLDTLRFLACSAYAGRLRVRPTAARSACEIVRELLDVVLRRDHGGGVEAFVQELVAALTGQPAQADGEGPVHLGEHGEVALQPGGGQKPPRPRPADEIPGLARPGGSGEPGESRSVPMVDRDRPSAGGTRRAELEGELEAHLRDLDEVLRRAREHVLRPATGRPHPAGPTAGDGLVSQPWTESRLGSLDVPATIEAVVAAGGAMEREHVRILERERQVRHYVILVDHSGSMAGRKLELGATMAAVLAHLTAAGRADYAVVAFDEALRDIKRLGEERDVEAVADEVLRLPQGRATDLGRALEAAARLADRAPESTDVMLISDCMPTRGVTSFGGLRELARRLPSLYVCFTDERSAAIRMFNGARQMDLYQWWARQWVGDDRLAEIGDLDELDRLVDLLAGDCRGRDI
jgi:MoxR-like ATPase/Mg-chelatase subunit ChlD